MDKAPSSSKNNKPKFTGHSRHEARKLAIQALYAWQLSGNTTITIKHALLDTEIALFPKQKQFDEEYFNELFDGICYQANTLDDLMQPFLDRAVCQLNDVELAILRLGVFELKFRPEIPYRVILNEAIILAKKFGAVDSHKYVNGVLDKLTQHVRASELRSKILNQLVPEPVAL